MADDEQDRRALEKALTYRDRYGLGAASISGYDEATKARLREEMDRRFPLLARLLREVWTAK